MVVPNPSAIVSAQQRSRATRMKLSTIQRQCVLKKKVQISKLVPPSTSEQADALLAREQLR